MPYLYNGWYKWSGYCPIMVAVLWMKGWVIADRCHSLKSDISPGVFHHRLAVHQVSSSPHHPQWHAYRIMTNICHGYSHLIYTVLSIYINVVIAILEDSIKLNCWNMGKLSIKVNLWKYYVRRGKVGLAVQYGVISYVQISNMGHKRSCN